MPCIYLFNFPNGKKYIGQTSNTFRHREISHKNTAFNSNSKNYNLIVYKAIRKYGWNNVERKCLKVCSKEMLNTLEIQYIKEYNTLHPNGYNLTTGGDSNYNMSNLTKLKMSETQNKRYLDPMEIKKCSIAQKKRYETFIVTDEIRTRMSKARSKYYETHKMSDDIKAKIGNRAKLRYNIIPMKRTNRNKISNKLRKSGHDLPMGISIRYYSNNRIKYRYRNSRLNVSKTCDNLDECIKFYNICCIKENIQTALFILNSLIARQQKINKLICIIEKRINDLYSLFKEEGSETKW